MPLGFIKQNLKLDKNNFGSVAVPWKEVSVPDCSQKRSISVAFITVRWQIAVGVVAFRNERSGVDCLSAAPFNSSETEVIVFWPAPGLLRSSVSEFCCDRGAKDAEGAKRTSGSGGDCRADAGVGRTA